MLYAKAGKLADLKGRFIPWRPFREYPVSIEEMHEAVQMTAAEQAAGHSHKRKRVPKSRRT